MPRFAANLHYLFTELPFLDRFEAAAKAGFRGVEFQVPYDHPPAVLRERLDAHGLTMVLFDAPMGDWNAGDRGLACIPGREAEFRASLDAVIRYGHALACDTVHVMAGTLGVGADRERCERTYIDNQRHAGERLAAEGIAVVIEPINPKFGQVAQGAAYTTEGMHGYFLNTSDQAVRLLDAIAHPNVHLHLDCYHMQILEGHLADTLRAHVGRLRHLQIAGVPGRHEPDVGEIHYPYLFDLLDTLGYGGWVGCEYRPRGATRDGLGWGARYGLGGG
ncbi:MAG: hydroxypyruvate isomerase family protein [Burkholderiales bacterium]|jgi:hydroxypyruvate isomerase|nr:hydroxypyruvate isomerase family protein [Burkholderiales bacterium]